MSLPAPDRVAGRPASPGAGSVAGRFSAAFHGFRRSWSRPQPERETSLRQMEAALVLLICASVLATAILADARIALEMRTNGPTLVRIFERITQLGTSGYIFAISGLLFAGSVLLQKRGYGRRRDVALAHLAGRAFFVLAVNAVAGILSQVLKHLFGRARPKLMDIVGPFHFDFLPWNATYASFPSGHTITAFCTAVAISYFVPRLRWPLLFIALLVALSRVIIGAHYPSDVLAGVAIGIGTAMLMRRAFARRALVFRKTAQGIQPRAFGRLWRDLRAPVDQATS